MLRYSKNRIKRPTRAVKKKKRVKPLGKIRKEVEKLAKLVAKIRDKWTCQKCGKKVVGSDAHGSHIIPVSHGNSLRFNPKNILCMCYHCHMNWWHKNPTEAGDWFSSKYPELKEYLNERKNDSVKFSYEEYEEMKMNLSIQVEKNVSH